MMYGDKFWIFVENEKKENKEENSEKSFGKWLLFFNWDEAWEQWKKIAIAIENSSEKKNLWINSKKNYPEDGELNSDQAKVSRQFEGNNYKKAVCCVYTSKKDIEIVREQLKKLSFINFLCYKTNEATEQSNYGHDSHLFCEFKRKI